MDRLPEKIFVIAGSMDQFRVFRNQLSSVLKDEGLHVAYSDIIYVSGPDRLRGYSSPWGYAVGTWSDRSDIWDIIDTINACRSNFKQDFIEVVL